MESVAEIEYISGYRCCRQRFTNSFMKTILNDHDYIC